MTAVAVSFQQSLAAGLTRSNRLRHPASVTTSDLLQSAPMSEQQEMPLKEHLLQHTSKGQRQEDLCFALWTSSTGGTRTTCVLREVILPRDGERRLHGNASFLPEYLDRVVDTALAKQAGIAFLHSHLTPGWQGMSDMDVASERRMVPSILGTTVLPLVGLTMGTDGALSARFWIRTGRREFER